MGSKFPSITNFISNQSLVKKTMGIAPERQVPLLAKKTFRKWHQNNKPATTNFPNGRFLGNLKRQR